MKKVGKKLFKSKLFIFILGGLVFSSISVSAVSLIYSKDVTYDNSSSGLSSTTVQGALDELYEKAKNAPSCDSDGVCTVSCKTGQQLILKSDTSYKCGVPPFPISDLKKKVVTSGDGLYNDSTISGRYIYRGSNPNNYIKLGSDMYRIIAIETDGTLKVIKNGSIGNQAFDTENARNGVSYCNSDYGCKVWGSKTTTLNSSGRNVTNMPHEIGGEEHLLPGREASLNTYLNTTWYNTLSSNIQKNIVTSTFNVGLVEYSETYLSTTIETESTYQWKGKIGLMNVSDYVKASTNTACTSVYAYKNTSRCYNNIETYNWIYAGPANKTYSWAISPSSSKSAASVWHVNSNGRVNDYSASMSYGVAPVFNLSSNISLSGAGTSDSPYVIE